jgi:Ca2+-binding RTX toxin-like protein
MRKIMLMVLAVGALSVPAASAQAQVATCDFLPVTISGTSGADHIAGTPGNDVIAAGAGNDRVHGLEGNDVVCLGPGSDSFTGGAGNDRVVAKATVDGADGFDGGVGVDTASYSARTTAVNVSLDGIAHDGASGEGDNNFANVENARGGTGNDTLVARNAIVRSMLFGGQGNDILIVNDNGSGDTVNGSFGADLCAADPGDTKISCEI